MSKRSYNSDLRQMQAQQARDRILSSAKKLFEVKGFEKVTIEEIAQQAEVSAPSIYSLFRSKSGLLREIMDGAFSAEHREALVEKVKIEKSPAKRLELAATISRRLYDAEKDQVSLFQGASILDPDFRKQEMEREERRYQRQEESVKASAQEKAFKKGITVTKARDILWAFTGRDLYRVLVLERSWSSDKYEKWLASVLIEMLLK